MRKFRHTASLFILIAQVLILAHNAVPHHHHDSHAIFGSDVISSHHHNHLDDETLHICSSHEEELCHNCFELLNNHSEAFGFFILTDFFQIKYRFHNNNKPTVIRSSDKITTKDYISLQTLRAPPFLM